MSRDVTEVTKWAMVELMRDIVLPFNDQRSADIVKKRLYDLSNKIDHILQPVFRSRKLGEKSHP